MLGNATSNTPDDEYGDDEVGYLGCVICIIEATGEQWSMAWGQRKTRGLVGAACIGSARRRGGCWREMGDVNLWKV